jgi:hypothetical protein
MPMRGRPLRWLLPLLLACLFWPRAARAEDPYVRWYTLESPHFSVHFHGGLERVAQKVANVAETAYARLVPELGLTPRERTQIVLTDVPEATNGFASTLPYPVVTLYVSAPDDMSALGDYDDWLTELVTHEFAHILHLSHVSGVPGLVNRVLGPTLVPNQQQPNWIIEGLAVAMETEHTTGGRLRATQFEMFLRADILSGKFARLDEISHLPRRWPGGTLWYLYGSKFVAWIASIYGPEIYTSVAADYGAQVFPYGVNRAIRRATGRTYSQLYAAWRLDLERKYRTERASVEARGLREGRRLTWNGWQASGPRFMPAACTREPRIVYLKSDADEPGGVYSLPLDVKPGDTAQLLARSSGQSAVFGPDCSLYFDSLAPSRRSYLFSDLFRLAPGVRSTTGNEKNRQRLTIGQRARDLDVSADGRLITYVTNDRGTSTLRIARLTADQRLEDERALIRSAEFEQAFTPRFSPDGTRVAYSTWTAGGYRDIRVVDIASGRFFELWHDRAVDQQPAFSPDGATLYFTSDRSGIANVYAYTLATGALAQVTNVLTGAYMPTVSPDGKTLAYLGYGSEGWDLYALGLDPTRFLAAEPSVNERPTPSSVSSMPYPVHEYRSWPTLAPRAWTFSLGTGTFGNALTLSTSGSDAIARHAYVASITVEERHVEPLGAIDYAYLRLPFAFRASLFRSAAPRDDYRTGEKARRVVEHQTGVTTGVALPVPGEFDAQNVSLSYTLAHWDHERPLGRLDPYAPLPYGPQRGLIGLVRLGYDFSNASTTPGAISLERGFRFALAADFADPAWGSESTLTAFSGAAAAYLPLPFLRHHVLALGLSGASATGSYTRSGYYSTGGFADTLPLDTLTSGIRQTGFVLRGYEPSQFVGSNFALFNAEYRFPIAYVDRGLSTLPGFLRTLSGTLFFDWGGTYDVLDLERPYDAFHVGIGAELWIDFLLEYVTGGELRLGLAKGMDSEARKKIQAYFVAASSF